jgi:hypothetical protein
MAHNGWERRRIKVRMTAEAAERAQRHADRLFIIAWNERMYVEGGPAQPSTIGMALDTATASCASAARPAGKSPGSP